MRNNTDRIMSEDTPLDDTVAADTSEQFDEEEGENEQDYVVPPRDKLSFAAPTEIVDLPSQGLLYPSYHPLHERDSLEIKFMTAKEEDILTSKSLIKKGIAVDRMLQNIILDKNIKVEDLLVGDKNALIVAARISGYGAEYEISFECPACGNKAKHEFDLSLLSNKPFPDFEELGVGMTEEGTFITNLIKTDAEVEFRLLTGRDELEMLNDINSKKGKNVALEDNSTSQLKRIIVAVNGETNRRVVNDFIESMPAIDSRYLRSLIKQISPEVDMTQDFECSSCGHEEEVEVPFTVEFFWPK